MKPNHFVGLNTNTVKAVGKTHNQKNPDGSTGIPLGNVEVENGEVIRANADGTSTIYSNRILVPGTDYTIAQYADILSKKKAPIERQYIKETDSINTLILSIKPTDSIQVKNTKERDAQKLTTSTVALKAQLNKFDIELDNLFKIQEEVKLNEQEAQEAPQDQPQQFAGGGTAYNMMRIGSNATNLYNRFFPNRSIPMINTMSTSSRYSNGVQSSNNNRSNYTPSSASTTTTTAPAAIAPAPITNMTSTNNAFHTTAKGVTSTASAPSTPSKAAGVAGAVTTGLQFLGSITNNIVNSVNASKAADEATPKQRMIERPRLKYRVNVNPQLEDIKDLDSKTATFIKGNTANSNVAHQMLQYSKLQTADRIQKVYQQKNQMEMEGENRNEMARYQTDAQNSQIDYQNQQNQYNQRMWAYQQRAIATNQMFDTIHNIGQSEKERQATALGFRIAAAQVPDQSARADMQGYIDSYSNGNSIGNWFKKKPKRTRK